MNSNTLPIIVNLTADQVIEAIGRWVVTKRCPEHEGMATVQVAFCIQDGDVLARAEVEVIRDKEP